MPGGSDGHGVHDSPGLVLARVSPPRPDQMGRAMTSKINSRSLAERVRAEPLLVPVWVKHEGRDVPGVLLEWDCRDGSWWGLVAWDPRGRQERIWLPAGRLRRIAVL